ncbi:MAG: hypothetical protein MI754_12880 [Chromatiales bacterium]|nr:hypothetical protein [Chromatiales bacterium]
MGRGAIRRGRGLLGAVLLLFGAAEALSDELERLAFSAETYQVGAAGKEKKGRIFVLGDLVRTEIDQGEDQVIKIFDLKKQVSYLLDPQRKQYQETPYRAVSLQVTVRPSNPCEGVTDAECKRVGDTSIAGRNAVEWDMLLRRNDKNYFVKQWIDIERGFVLRYLTEDGHYSSMEPLGVEQLDGRKVEKWMLVSFDGEQRERRSVSWFDPQLNMVIKEEHPGGYLREMRTIRVGPQEPGQFEVPADYRRVDRLGLAKEQ